MTAPYIPSQSGWKPRKPATDLLTSTLGNRFGGPQEQPSAPAASWMQPQQPQQPAQPAPSPYAPQPARGAPATAPAPSAPVNPFRAQPASSLAPPTPQPGTPPNSGAPTAPQPTNPYTPPPAAPTTQPSTPAMPGSPATPNAHPHEAGGEWYSWLNQAYPNVGRFFGGATAADNSGDPNSAASRIHQLAQTEMQRRSGGNFQWTDDPAFWQGMEEWASSPQVQQQVNALLAEDRTARPGVYDAQNQPAAHLPPGQKPETPNASASYSMFGADPELDALVKAGLAQPSRFDNDLVTSMWNSRAGDIDTEYDQANRGLSENLARRGIRDSTFGGEKQQHLAGERRSAKSRALQSLSEDIAGTMSTDRSRAISDAMSLRSQATGERQFGQNFGLAERFGVDDRNYRNRESDWQHGFQTETFNAGRQDSADDLYKWLVQQGLI